MTTQMILQMVWQKDEVYLFDRSQIDYHANRFREYAFETGGNRTQPLLPVNPSTDLFSPAA